MADYKISPTRFKNLGYVMIDKGLWRFCDLDTCKENGGPYNGACHGPQYPTKAELLADLHRYATLCGCEGA